MQTNNKPTKSSNFKQLFALIPYFKPYIREAISALFALIITALMILFFGKAIKYLIDFGFSEQNQFWLNFIVAIFFVAVAIMAVAGYYRSFLVNSVCERVIADLRKKVYDHIIHVSAEFFEVTKTGDVISRLTSDTVILYGVISNSISFLLRNILLFIGGIVFLFLTSVKLTLVSLALIIFAVFPIIWMGKLVKKLSHQTQNALSSVSSRIEESINGIRTIQSYLCEEKEVRNFGLLVDSALNCSLDKIRIKSLMISVVISIAFGAIAIVILIGSHDVLHRQLTSGELSSFVFYSVIVATSLVALSQVSGQLQSASASASRIFELLESSSAVKENENPKYFPAKHEIDIKFENVNFSYPTRKEFPILRDFSIEIKSGQKVAIVGPSGAGKSTILQLLLRFYEVDSGYVKLNSVDIRDIALSDLRKNFSYISQDCFIFSGTIFENIAYVDKSITEKEVREIVEKNSALHFIKNLPDQLQSFVGEKGIKLSGGERQRIAIARAIIKNSPILLLDEATSALDNQNEKSINQTILELAENKTVITIAHKLSSVINSEKIIFIKDGKISEYGNHHDLMSHNGLYKNMYEIEKLNV